MPLRPILLTCLAALALLTGARAATARPAPAAEPATRAAAWAFADRMTAALNAPARADGTYGLSATADWYDPTWLALVDENDRLSTARDVDSFFEGVDPVCDCEHPGFRYAVHGVSIRRSGDAVVSLGVNNGSEWNDHPVILRRIAGHWRIYNAITEGEDWRAFLTRHVACLRRATSHAEAERRCTAVVTPEQR